jgi:hypothetical protein
MENKTNLGLFALQKIISEYAESISGCQRIFGNYLSTYGEYAKRILPYSPYIPRDIILSIS